MRNARRTHYAAGLRWFDGGEGDDDGGAGGAGADDGKGGVKLDLNDPKVKAAVDEIVASQVSGLKQNRDQLKGEKEKLQEQLAKMTKDLEGLPDPEKLRELMARINENEETRLIAEGKVDEVVERRVGSMRSDYEGRLEQAAKRIKELEDTGVAKDDKIKTLVIDAKIRDAASKIEGFQPTAVEDAILLARSTFGLDDKGNPVAHDAEGVTLMGKDGKSPLTPADWLRETVKTRVHWLAGSAGGGANGGGDPGGRKPGVDLDRLSPRDKLKAGLVAQADA